MFEKILKIFIFEKCLLIKLYKYFVYYKSINEKKFEIRFSFFLKNDF